MKNKTRDNLINSVDEGSSKDKVGKLDEKLSNRRLLTPRTRKLMNNLDAKGVLFDEIYESVLRLK